MATILCIDDEPAELRVRELLLKSAGYRVVGTTSGEEGIRLFQEEPFDAVVLDYWMSGMRGTDVARELKRINPRIPIIVHSGFGQLPDETIGIADRWIVKGESPEYLLGAIKTILQERPLS